MQDKQIAVFAFALFDHIHTGDAEINTAIAHTDDDIRRALEQDFQPGQCGKLCLILARVGLVDCQAAGGKKFKRIIGQAAFRREADSKGV